MWRHRLSVTHESNRFWLIAARSRVYCNLVYVASWTALWTNAHGHVHMDTWTALCNALWTMHKLANTRPLFVNTLTIRTGSLGRHSFNRSSEGRPLLVFFRLSSQERHLRPELKHGRANQDTGRKFFTFSSQILLNSSKTWYKCCISVTNIP